LEILPGYLLGTLKVPNDIYKVRFLKSDLPVLINAAIYHEFESREVLILDKQSISLIKIPYPPSLWVIKFKAYFKIFFLFLRNKKL